MTASQGRPPAPTVQKTIRHPAAAVSVDVRTWKRNGQDKYGRLSCLESWLFVVKLFPSYSPFVMLSFLNNRSIVLRACRTSEDPLLFRMPNACLASMGSGFHTQLRRACSASLHEYNESLSDRPRIVDSQRIMTVVNQTFQEKEKPNPLCDPLWYV